MGSNDHPINTIQYNTIRQTGSFSVTDPFLTRFYYVEKRNGILGKNGGEGFQNLTYPYMGEGAGVQKLPKSSLSN